MDTSKAYRIAEAAKALGIARSTIQSAIGRGEIPSHQTACGLPLVDLADVRRWAKIKRKPGRPRKSS